MIFMKKKIFFDKNENLMHENSFYPKPNIYISERWKKYVGPHT